MSEAPQEAPAWPSRKWPNRWADGDHDPELNTSGDTPLTRQEFKDEADINNVVRRMLNGQSVPLRQPQYGDADYTSDLTDAYRAVEEIVETYEGLPKEVKATMNKSEFVSRILNGEQLDAFSRTNPEKEDPAKSAEPPKDTQASA